MDDIHSQSVPPLSRAGRILKKSAKQIEAEESFLTEAYLMQISRRKPRSFEDTVHCLGVVDNSLIKEAKVFDFKLRPGSTHSISLSLTDEDVTSESFKDTINGFQVMNNGLNEESEASYSKRRTCSTLSTSPSSADTDETNVFSHLDVMKSSLNEENKVVLYSKRHPGSTHSTFISSNDADETLKSFQHLNLMNNSLTEEKEVKMFYSKHRPGSTYSTYFYSTDADETPKSFKRTFQHINLMNNSLNEEEEVKMFYSKHRPGSIHSTYFSSTDADETPKSLKRTFQHINLMNNSMSEEEEVKMFYSKHRPGSTHSTCLSSIDADETPKSFKRTFQHLNRMNNSLNEKEEVKMFYYKHRPGSTPSTYLSLNDADETPKSFKRPFHHLDLTNNGLDEESKVLYSKRRSGSNRSPSLSSTDDDVTLETGSENSRQALSTPSSSEYLQDYEEEEQDNEGITDHKYCTRFRRTRNSISVATRKPPMNALGNVALTRAKSVNAYTLWSSLNRRIISATNKNLQRQDISKKVIEEWNALPPEEKKFWARKAKELSERIRNRSFSSGSDAGASVVPSLAREDSDCDAGLKTKMKDHILSCVPSKSKRKKKREDEHVLGIAPVDTAAHLKLLGDSMTEIGQKILQADMEPSATGAYCVLLDSLLCSMGALLCLTREIPGLEQLPSESFAKTLDHIAYFMPGL